VGGSPMELDSRPSDAIALAIRAKAPVFAEERVFEKADRVPSLGAGERI
jgi:bifunctional DNase/RNase